MDLHTFLHSEGKQRHDSILYRRLALLPGLCSDPSSSSSSAAAAAADAQAATAAVLKGPPPAPPLLDDAAFRPPPSAHLHRVHHPSQHDGPPLPTPPRHHPHRPSSCSATSAAAAAAAAASPGSLRAAVQRSTRGRAERVRQREADAEGGSGGGGGGGGSALAGFGALGRVARVLKKKRKAGEGGGVCYRGEEDRGEEGAAEEEEYDEEKRAAAMASGFAELHAAISATIGTIAAATGQDLGRCFDLLSSHIKGYTHDADAEALRAALEKLAERSGDDRAGGARVALCMLDHAFLLVGNLHPALRSVLRWCRSRLADCLYCERGCIAPGDVGLSDDRMDASRALYTGPPPPPPPGAAGEAEAAAVVAAASSEAAAVRLMERYGGRLACEDNRELQGRQRAAHDVIREERALTQRRLHAEQSVSEYWQRTVRGVLFMAWRRVLGDDREARLAGEDRLLLERDVSLAKRAAAEQARERVRVEATLYEKVTQAEQKLLAAATSLKVSDDAVLAAAAAAKQQKTRMVQLRAEQVLLRDRMRRALARQELAEREEAELRAALASAQAAAAEAAASRERHEALRAACASYVRRVRFSDAMLRVRGGVGTLARWYTTLLQPGGGGGGGGGGGRHWVDGLVRGLRETFASEVSSADAERVVKESDDLKKAELAVALLRRLLGGGMPVHRNALVPPIQHDAALGVVVMLATRACAPAPPAKKEGGAEEGVVGEGEGEGEEDLAARMRGVEAATVHAFDTLAGVAGDLLRWPTSQQEALLVAPHVSPAEWAPAAGLPEGAPKVVRVMAKHGKLEPVLERVRSSAVGLACLRAHYSPVYLVSTSVQAMLHDAGVRPEAEAEVMGHLPTDGRVEVSPHSFAMCLVAGALKQFPGTPAADAFDRLLREVLYPRCRIRGVRGGVADVLVRHRDAARAAYAEIASGGGGGGGGGNGSGAGGTVGHSGLAAFLEARGAVVSAASPGGGGGDPEGGSPVPVSAAAWRVAVSAKQFREMFEACLVPELGGKAARADAVVRFPQFLSLLQLVSEAVYPNPTVPAHERLGRFFTEVLQFSTPQQPKKEPEKKQQQKR